MLANLLINKKLLIGVGVAALLIGGLVYYNKQKKSSTGSQPAALSGLKRSRKKTRKTATKRKKTISI